MATKNKYIFKYNQEGKLYNYVELNRVGKVASYFKLEGRKLIRFDRGSDIKQVIVFKTDVILKQKFLSGERFITVFDAETEDCVQHKLPAFDKRITLVKNNLTLSDFGKFVVERWRLLNKKKAQALKKNFEENTFKTTKEISSPLLSLISNKISVGIGKYHN